MTKETIKVDTKDCDREHICGFCKYQSYVGTKEGFVCLCEKSPKHLSRINFETHCNEWKERKD